MTLLAVDLYALVQQIPAGRVTTYQLLAQALGFPRSARYVGQLLKRNPTPLVVPCHRVIASNGKVSGYFGVVGGCEKINLLVEEGVTAIRKGSLTAGELRAYCWQPERAESAKVDGP
jgi:O-6-methylguanine DNA methyltransferase